MSMPELHGCGCCCGFDEADECCTNHAGERHKAGLPFRICLRSKLGGCGGLCMRQDPVPNGTNDLLLLGSKKQLMVAAYLR